MQEALKDVSFHVKKGEKIAIEKVSFSYPDTDKEVLKDIFFSVQKGEKIGIVGFNGSGKTTLVKLICGFYIPSKGRILINDKPIETYDKKVTRK